MSRNQHMGHNNRSKIITFKGNECGEGINVITKMDEIKQSFIAAGAHKGLNVPDMPDVIKELEQEIRKRYPNTNTFVRIIEKNTVIAGELLAIVKSPAYLRHVKRDIEVKTIENVVNLIGLPQTFRLAQAAAIKNIPQKTSLFRSVIDHSSDVAVGCAEIAGYVQGVDLDEAYMFGLFRDAGAIGMSIAFESEYDEHWERIKSFPRTGIAKEYDALNARHDHLGVVVARKWGFGEAPGDKEIMLAIQEHHNFNQVSCFNNEKVRLLVAIGLLAENLVNEINGESYVATEAEYVRNIAIDALFLPDDLVTLIRRHLLSSLVSGNRQ